MWQRSSRGARTRGVKIEAIIYSLIKTSEDFEAVQGATKDAGGGGNGECGGEKEMAEGRTDGQQEKMRHSRIWHHIILAPVSRDGMITEPEQVVSIIHLSGFDRHVKRKSVVTNRTIPDPERRHNDKMSKRPALSPDLVTSISENPY